MKAIILAAGQGTRLKKYTENLPKGMLEFQGKTIIERQLETYRSMGIDDIIVVRGFAAIRLIIRVRSIMKILIMRPPIWWSLY